MSFVTSQSSESLRRTILKSVKAFMFIALCILTAALLGCNFPGGMSDQAFHVKADGREHILTGYLNSTHSVVPIVYYNHCAVINNTPSKHNLMVTKILPGGSPPEILAKKVKYEAQLKEGLYLITAFGADGHVTDFCQIHVIFKDQDRHDFSGF